jgi:hypothetical protein
MHYRVKPGNAVGRISPGRGLIVGKIMPFTQRGIDPPNE